MAQNESRWVIALEVIKRRPWRFWGTGGSRLTWSSNVTGCVKIPWGSDRSIKRCLEVWTMWQCIQQAKISLSSFSGDSFGGDFDGFWRTKGVWFISQWLRFKACSGNLETTGWCEWNPNGRAGRDRGQGVPHKVEFLGPLSEIELICPVLLDEFFTSCSSWAPLHHTASSIYKPYLIYLNLKLYNMLQYYIYGCFVWSGLIVVIRSRSMRL